MSALKEQMAETVVGAIVAAVAIGFLAFAVARAGASGPANGAYDVVARFQNAGGIAAGADVRMSGVKIGAVKTVKLNPDYFAAVTLAIDPAVKIPDDSSVRVSADGLLGGSFIAVEPGGSPDMVKAGDELANTQSAIDLVTLLIQAASGAGRTSEATAKE
jgi:phospholipid/cholesterol/gamma-HCH transport system substrate-binding protein